MFLPDVNILVYAHREDSPHHKTSLQWLERSEERRVGKEC